RLVHQVDLSFSERRRLLSPLLVEKLQLGSYDFGPLLEHRNFRTAFEGGDMGALIVTEIRPAGVQHFGIGVDENFLADGPRGLNFQTFAAGVSLSLSSTLILTPELELKTIVTLEVVDVSRLLDPIHGDLIRTETRRVCDLKGRL